MEHVVFFFLKILGGVYFLIAYFDKYDILWFDSGLNVYIVITEETYYYR